MFCTSCGTKNPADSNFCRQCGFKIEKEVSTRLPEADYERALPEEEQVSHLLERAYRLKSSGELDSAVELCQEALRLRPDSTSAHAALSELFRLQGDRDRAIREQERVVQLNPGSIADRIKLDELRGKTTVPSARGGSPQVVLTDARKAGAPTTNRFGLALVAGGIFVLIFGGAMAWQMRSKTDRTPVQNAGKISAQATPSQTAENAKPGGAAEQPGGIQIAQNPPAAQPPSAGSAFETLPMGPTGMNAGQSPPPQIIREYHYPPNPSGVRPAASNPGPAPVNTLPNMTEKQQPVANENTTGSERVLLDGNDGIRQVDKNKYVMNIQIGNKANGGSESPAGATANNGQPGNSNGNGSGRIVLANESPDAGTSRGPDSAARSKLVIGNDLRVKGDFGRAIRAYQQALPSAGDQAGYVYQQIGYCYQQQGNKSSARTNYENAIVEYEKLISAGRMVEYARDGIRACRNGIKVCE